MPGNSSRRGAVRKSGKGRTAGSGGRIRRGLEGKGPTPKAKDREGHKAYKAAYKTDVSTFGGYAYDGLMLAVQALKKAGSTDKAKVRDALEATKNYVGTGGVVNMSATDHMGLDLSAFRMLEIKDGNWSLVK